jgi:hypothetical protein
MFFNINDGYVEGIGAACACRWRTVGPRLTVVPNARSPRLSVGDSAPARVLQPRPVRDIGGCATQGGRAPHAIAYGVGWWRVCADTDLKLHLASTDYGNFLSNEPSPLATTTIAEACIALLLPTHGRAGRC